MVLVAITGNIACGKSTLLNEFRKLGEKCIDCDEISREVYKLKTVKKMLVKTFGTCDRKKIAKIVFRDHKARKKLEAIIHPFILRRLKRFIDSRSEDRFFIEVPLLYECSLEKFFDYVVVVKAPKKIQLKRIVSRGLTEEEALLRIKTQFPLSKKIKMADFVVDGTKNKSQLKQIAKDIIERVKT
ncbi:MAG: dephospho-CoA kinase [Candidatus Diapherotrites archaeon]